MNLIPLNVGPREISIRFTPVLGPAGVHYSAARGSGMLPVVIVAGDLLLTVQSVPRVTRKCVQLVVDEGGGGGNSSRLKQSGNVGTIT